MNKLIIFSILIILKVCKENIKTFFFVFFLSHKSFKIIKYKQGKSTVIKSKNKHMKLGNGNASKLWFTFSMLF